MFPYIIYVSLYVLLYIGLDIFVLKDYVFHKGIIASFLHLLQEKTLEIFQ